MAEDPPAGAARAGPGLQALLRRAAEDDAFRAVLLERRGEAAREAGVTLTDSEKEILRVVDDAAIAQMIDGLATSERARLQPPQPPAWDGDGPAPVPAGIMPDVPPVVSLGISPDEPPPVTRGISPDLPPDRPEKFSDVAITGIGPDMPPEWKPPAYGRRRWLLLAVLVALVVGGVVAWWLTR